MTDFFIPIVIAIIFLAGITKKIDIFHIFIEGAKDGLQTSISILPVLIGIITLINMLAASGFLEYMCKIL